MALDQSMAPLTADRSCSRQLHSGTIPTQPTDSAVPPNRIQTPGTAHTCEDTGNDAQSMQFAALAAADRALLHATAAHGAADAKQSKPAVSGLLGRSVLLCCRCLEACNRPVPPLLRRVPAQDATLQWHATYNM